MTTVVPCVRGDFKKRRYELIAELSSVDMYSGSESGSECPSGSQSEYEPGKGVYCGIESDSGDDSGVSSGLDDGSGSDSCSGSGSGTILDALMAVRFDSSIRKGDRYELRGTNGRATVKIHLDTAAPGRLVVVLEAILIRKGCRRSGVATQFVQSLARIFQAKPRFSSLQVESVLSPEMAALCRKEGMITSNDSDFYLVF